MENIILFAALAVLTLFMFRNNKKRKQQAEELQGSIAVGANVMLTSGIYGRITAIDGDKLVIESTPGTSLSVVKLAVREIIAKDAAVAKTATKSTKPAAKTAAKPATAAKKTAK